MAYTPVNWQTGDTITAERLNRMDRGWGFDSTQLFSETVTAADNGSGMYSAQLAYSQLIDADTITVTFDGAEYTCPRIEVFDQYFYGGFSEQGPVFTEYPFAINSTGHNTNAVYTETAGEHTVAVSAQTLQTSADFDTAVNSIVDAAINAVSQSLPLRCISGQTDFSAMRDAQTDGRLMYFQRTNKTYFVHNVIQSLHGGKTAEFFPENSGMTVGFDENSVFTVTESS